MTHLQQAIEAMLEAQVRYRHAQRECSRRRREAREKEDAVHQLRGQVNGRARARTRRERRAA